MSTSTMRVPTPKNIITPELQAKLDKAREKIRNGHCVVLKSHDDIDKYFNKI